MIQNILDNKKNQLFHQYDTYFDNYKNNYEHLK
jgi:hypothetical protein